MRGLRAAGQRALQVADLALDPVFAACRAEACAGRAAQAAQVTVALFTFLPASGSAAPQLELHAYEPDGKQSVVRASLGGGRSLSQAAAGLFEASRRQLALGAGSLLSIASVPVGAVIWVDGQPAGVTPFERSLSAGEHALRITLEGFEPEQQRVQLERGELRTLETRLARAPHGGLTDRATDGRLDEASPWNFVLGGVLALAALPALIEGANGLANDGQCLQQDAAGSCSEVAHFRTGGAVMLAAGGVALAAGAYFLIAQPFRVEAVTTAGGAQLRVRARF